jgi:UDP-N-acetylglucosamine 4-epimerase
VNARPEALAALRAAPRRWLITGVTGFIGSHLLEHLLAAGQTVVGLDSGATGKRSNADAALAAAGKGAAARFTLLEGDIRSLDACRRACQDVDVVLHQAAQVSVPASLTDPATTLDINVTGFTNLLRAAVDAKVRRVIYASSCAIYGDSPQLPLSEEQPGRPLSPYAASKLVDELIAGAFATAGSLEAVGLRYFNVYGPRQDPKGVYAAVIPLWIASMIRNAPVRIFGDGSTTRDFCHIANVVQANVLAATASLGASGHEVVNVAVGGRTSLNDLFASIRRELLPACPHLQGFAPIYEDFRPGDIRHSHASIAKAQRLLGYAPTHPLEVGLKETIDWFRKQG